MLFAVDTGVLNSSRNFKDFSSVSNLHLAHMNKWFAANLVLNLDKTYTMKFITKNSSHGTLHIGCKCIEETVHTKFLGLQLDNHINCKNHIEEVIPKLCGACYAIMSVVLISNINTCKSIYYAYFHSFIKYGIICWGNSSNSGKIFTVENKIMIIVNAQPRTSCRSLFKQLKILPVPCH